MSKKAWRITYYILLSLLSAMLLFSGYQNAVVTPAAHELFVHLQLPDYISVIVGVAKLLAVIGIWQTKWPTLREWTYAGLFYDFFGALLCFIAIGEPVSGWFPMVIMIVVLIFGPYYSRKKAGK